MREARHLEKSAALVTPDRALARRVTAALARWNLAFDDSGGDALIDTPAGIFARLAAEAVAKELEPPTLLALLKHPLCRLGAAPGAFRAPPKRSNWRCCAARGRRLEAADSRRISRASAANLKKLRAGETSSLHARGAADPAAAMPNSIARKADRRRCRTRSRRWKASHPAKPYDFVEIATRHRDVLIELSRDADGVAIAFEGSRARRSRPRSMNCSATEAKRPDGAAAGLSGSVPDRLCRPHGAAAGGAKRQLQIYGPLEARLTQSDRVIIGGLVEGVWPPAPRIDPWLSRPMRHELGLDLPERRIGLSAHDFAQLLGAEDVILSHAAKVGGAPAVASRFLHRLEAVAGEARWRAAKSAGQKYVRFASELDAPDEVEPVAQPAPRPPRATGR